MRNQLLALALLVAGCSGSDAPAAVDAAAGVPDAEVGKDRDCADTFGDVLTDSFGRVDGTVVAIVEPGNTRCVAPNSDHVIVQVELDGAVYRMVANVQSDGVDPEIRVRAIDAALPAPAFAEGWHTGVAFDYATDLATHSTDAWDSLALADARILDPRWFVEMEADAILDP